MTDFNKQIGDIAIRLPKLPTKRVKNLYDILGVRNKETVNSRILAYFLDSYEEHKFGNLFINSLKELIQEKDSDAKLELFNGKFNVITEDQTYRSEDELHKQKRIDISLEGNNWSIIIENKIYHVLNNPLKTYWEHASKKAENVIGIILSISKIPQNECLVDGNVKFINITHKELVNRVQKNLIIGTKTSDTGLFYLKEYFKSIESHYKTKTDRPKMNEIVTTIIEHRKDIKEINEKIEKSLQFIKDEIHEIFEGYGFKKVAQWYRNHDKHSDLFFWVCDSKDILFHNNLWFCFETRNGTNRQLDKKRLKEFHKELTSNDPRLIIGDSKPSKAQTHIVEFHAPNFLQDGLNFRTAFTEILETHFMKPEAGIVDKTVAFLNKTIVKEKVS